MSAKIEIKDGTGTNQVAKVDTTGPQEENAVWVHLAGITPEVSVPVFDAPVAGGESFDQFLLNGASKDMAINGSVTAVDFRVEADATDDIIITDMILAGQDGSIKFSNWFALNSPLSPGVEISLKSDDKATTYDPLTTTTELMAFSSGDIENSSVTGEAVVISFRKFSPSLIIRAQGTHGGASTDDDFIQVKIQDNLTGMDSFTCQVRGVKVPAGTF